MTKSLNIIAFINGNFIVDFNGNDREHCCEREKKKEQNGENIAA